MVLFFVPVPILYFVPISKCTKFQGNEPSVPKVPGTGSLMALLKDGLYMEVNDARIIKSELKVITTAPSHTRGPGRADWTDWSSGTAQFTAVGGSCNQTPISM